MVHLAKPTLALALTLLNLLPAAAAADPDLDAVLQKFPEFAPLAKDGALEVAYIDPATHKVVKEDFGKGKKEKRDSMFRSHLLLGGKLTANKADDTLTRLLKQKRAYGWCEAYCEKPKPFTSTKVVYVTTTVCGYGQRCRPSTATVKRTTTQVADTTVTCEPTLPPTISVMLQPIYLLLMC